MIKGLIQEEDITFINIYAPNRETPKYVESFPGDSVVKKSACIAQDADLTPGSGRSPVGGHCNPFKCSYLENIMDRGAWQTPWSCKELNTTEVTEHT